MGRPPKYDRPMTQAERQAERRKALVTFRPTDVDGLREAAAARGVTPSELTCRIVDAWMENDLPPDAWSLQARAETALAKGKPLTVTARAMLGLLDWIRTRAPKAS